MIHIKRHLLFNGPVGGLTDDSGEVTILKTDYLKKWKEHYKKPYEFFTEEFQTSWEEKTGMVWREWGK